ncbi:MAG: MarR family transcriptional regulator [Kordiimonadaceae bacterium]|nr:MarR family transcriptional regulator [Kordiimonadaceae bacterium]
MRTEAKRLNSVIRDVRTSFNLLQDRSNNLLQDLDVNASMRFVLENLSVAGEKTVPEIARSKNVSRQHIQIVVNELLEKGLVISRANPSDKRSYLISLTELGDKIFSEIRNRELVELQNLSEYFTAEELRVTSKMLQKLSKFLS